MRIPVAKALTLLATVIAVAGVSSLAVRPALGIVLQADVSTGASSTVSVTDTASISATKSTSTLAVNDSVTLHSPSSTSTVSISDNVTVAVIPPSIYTVNTTDDQDDGVCDATHCSLREAISASNDKVVLGDIVAFDITTTDPGYVVGTASWRIQPTSSLPTITDPIVIDGYTQTGATQASAGTPAVLKVQLSGALAGVGVDGLTATSSQNVIRGLAISEFQEAGIRLGEGSGSVVAGNYIGTDVTGALFGNNNYGIIVDGSGSNTIGGTSTADRNVISGNQVSGVWILNAGATGNRVLGNYIGVEADGSSAHGNISHGVHIEATSTSVGGNTPSAGNVIAHNLGDGVYVESGAKNSILGNSIFSNAGLGIDLGANGVNDNDFDDSDSGANGLQNFPTTTRVLPGSVTIRGIFTGAASTPFRLVFFSNASCDGSGHGQGATFLGATTVTTSGANIAIYEVTFPTSISSGDSITGTATDPDGNTSEFSRCFTADFFTVDSFADAGDSNTGDGICDDGTDQCTLRAAIREANATPGADVIYVSVPTTTLTIVGTGEDIALTGDLDIAAELAIVGDGPGTTTIDGNRSVVGDHVFHVLSGVTTTVRRLTVTNSGPSSGNSSSIGGFYNQSGILMIEEVEVSGGTGAGVYNKDGDLEVTDSTFTGNYIGIYANHNTAGSEQVTLNRILITGSTNGLLINKQNSSLTLRLTNSTITGNTDAGIDFSSLNTGSGQVRISHSTIANNKYGIEEETDTAGDTIRIKNSIVAYNSSLDCRFRNVAHDIISDGNNIASDGTCDTLSLALSDQTSTDPLLGALQDAGGPSLTRPPLAGSAAIDAVPQASSTDYLSTVLVVDQRGFARPVNTKSDVGAYEFNDSGLAVNLGRIIHSQAAGVTTSTTLSVSSTGAVALTWTASENPATSWISLVPTSSSAAVAPGGSEQVQVVFDSTGLADGRYSTTLEFNGDDPGPTVEVPVLFCVPDPCGAADSPWPQFRNDTLNTGRSAIAGPDAAVEKWSYTTGGAIGFPSPSIGPDATIYVASGDNKLYAVNPDGTFKWSFLMGDSIVGSPAIAGDGTHLPGL